MSDAERFEVSRTISAPAADIFQLVSDPHGHVKIDGSGMLIGPQDAQPTGAVGDSFLMDMDGVARGLPQGGTYTVLNTVTKYQDGTEFEWTVGMPGSDPIGHVYGFVLKPVSDSETQVTHYCDWSAVNQQWRELITFPVIMADGLQASLENLDRVVTESAG